MNERRLRTYKAKMESIRNTFTELYDLYKEPEDDDIEEIRESLKSIIEDAQSLLDYTLNNES